MKTRIEIQNIPTTYSGVKSPQIGRPRSDSADAMTVAVAYADTVTRERAMLLCDHLVHKLWQGVDFEITWWKFDYLNHPRIAAAAAGAARRADMVIFSTEADRELTPAVQSWVESWAARRESREGALVALIGNAGLWIESQPRFMTERRLVRGDGKLDARSIGSLDASLVHQRRTTQ